MSLTGSPLSRDGRSPGPGSPRKPRSVFGASRMLPNKAPNERRGPGLGFAAPGKWSAGFGRWDKRRPRGAPEVLGPLQNKAGASLPLVGRAGWGRAAADRDVDTTLRRATSRHGETPTPSPSPQGGGGLPLASVGRRGLLPNGVSHLPHAEGTAGQVRGLLTMRLWLDMAHTPPFPGRAKPGPGIQTLDAEGRAWVPDSPLGFRERGGLLMRQASTASK